MTRRHFRYLLALVGLTVASGGCAHNVYSPPARAIFAESSAVVGAGSTAVQLGGAAHGTVFDFDAIAGAARIRRGFTDSVEASADVGIIHISGNSAADTHPNVYSLRLGTKYSPEPLGGHFALIGGLGAGVSAAGFFTAADAGLILAWENDYVVPFLSAQAFLSLPIDPSAIDTTPAGDPVGTNMDTPELTWGYGAHWGIRVPLSFGTQNAYQEASLYLGMDITHLDDDDAGETAHGFGGGLEFVF